MSNPDDGGRLKGAARLAVRFHELTLDDGTVVEFSSRSFERVGPSTGRTTATRTGGAAAVGARIGGIEDLFPTDGDRAALRHDD